MTEEMLLEQRPTHALVCRRTLEYQLATIREVEYDIRGKMPVEEIKALIADLIDLQPHRIEAVGRRLTVTLRCVTGNEKVDPVPSILARYDILA